MIKTVVATFQSFSDAQNAAKAIKDNGLRTDDISIVAKEVNDTDETASAIRGTTMGGEQTENYAMNATGESANDNISDGVITGGILGGLAGLLIGAGSMIVPGLGVVAAAGPITGLLSGAVTGGIVGGLVDLGIPEEKSKAYENELKQGKILFSMRTDDSNMSRIENVLKSNNAVSVDTY